MINFLMIFFAFSLAANFFPLAVGGTNCVRATYEFVTRSQSINKIRKFKIILKLLIYSIVIDNSN